MELSVCLLIVSFLGNECCVQNITKKKKQPCQQLQPITLNLLVYARELEGLSRQGKHVCLCVHAHALGVQVRSVFQSF